MYDLHLFTQVQVLLYIPSCNYIRKHRVHYSYRCISVNRESSENNYNDDFPDPWSPPPGPINLNSGSEVSVRVCVCVCACACACVHVCEFLCDIGVSLCEGVPLLQQLTQFKCFILQSDHEDLQLIAEPGQNFSI